MRKVNDTVEINVNDVDQMYDYLLDAYNRTRFTSQSYMDTNHDRIFVVQRICKGCTKSIYDSSSRATFRDMLEEISDQEHLLFKLDLMIPAFVNSMEDVIKEKRDGKIIMLNSDESYFIRPFGKGFTVHPVEEDTLEVYYEFSDTNTMLYVSAFFTLVYVFPLFQEEVLKDFEAGKLTEADVPRIHQELKDHVTAIFDLTRDADIYFDKKFDKLSKEYENLSRDMGIIHTDEVTLVDENLDKLFLALEKDLD